MAARDVKPDSADKPAKPRRRWYQFTLRTAGIVLLIFFVLLGGFAEWRHRSYRHRRIAEELKELGAGVDNESFYFFAPTGSRLASLDNYYLLSARVRYFLGDDFTSEIVSVTFTTTESKKPPAINSSKIVDLVKWLSRLRTFRLEGDVSPRDLREFPFTSIVEDFAILLPQDTERGQLTDNDLAAFKKANQLQVLFLSRQRIEGAGLSNLQNCPLRELYLSGTGLGDQGLAHLQMHDKLKILWLRDNPITDRGIAEVQFPQSLECIVLTNTRVGDRALDRLQQLPNLVALHIGQTEVTQDGLRRFYAAKPQCAVVWDDMDDRLIKYRW